MFGIINTIMRIGILTQPLRTNYGGLLQAFALQTVLTRLGHEAMILNRCYTNAPDSLVTRMLRIKNILIGRDVVCKDENRISKAEEKISKFIQNRYKLTDSIYTTEDLKKCVEKEKLNAIVVGSDQVWRPRYSPNIFNYFLDFLDSKAVKRYSYAASFGVDLWEYNQDETERCSRLAQLFDGITVRESSAVELCKENLGVKAEHVLDPTLLLSAQDYMDLISTDIEKSSGELFTYILDSGAEKDTIIEMIAKATNHKPFACMPKLKLTYKNARKNLEDCKIPAVEQWIQSFVDANMVVTDSFHGTVFSIIFNKPFWVVANPQRGNTRMESLLAVFDLKDRMLTEENIANKDLNAPIDWEKVNSIKKDWQKKSMEFLKNI